VQIESLSAACYRRHHGTLITFAIDVRVLTMFLRHIIPSAEPNWTRVSKFLPSNPTTTFPVLYPNFDDLSAHATDIQLCVNHPPNRIVVPLRVRSETFGPRPLPIS
jgi:hypothetical protein